MVSQVEIQNGESVLEGAGAVYRDILKWGAALPRWQQELLRRVVSRGELSADEVKELAAAAVTEHELQPSSYEPLAPVDFPSVASSGSSIYLAAIRHVRNVNVLREDQNLMFGRNLTVIYGDNASGKSGYARVLKKIYRARVVDDILGDVRGETPPTGRPSATFVVHTASGEERSVGWTDGAHVTAAGRFAVLDSVCASTYVRGGTLEMGPAGIDIPQRFATELDQVKKHLAALAAARQPSKQAIQHLEDDTETGRFIKTLSAKTPMSAISRVISWTPEHENRLNELQATIAVAKTQSLAVRRKGLASRAKALLLLRDRIAKWIDVASPQYLTECKAAVSAVAEAEAALRGVRDLGDSCVSEGRLKGAAWTNLLNAAARYVQSMSSASTISLSMDERCVLCWQELDAGARHRLLTFQQHLEGTAHQSRTIAKKRLEESVASLRQIPASLAPEDEMLVSSSEGAAAQLDNLVGALAGYRDQLLAGIESGSWPENVLPDQQVLPAVNDLYESTCAELNSLPATDAEAERVLSILESQHKELVTRKAAAEAVSEIIRFVSNTIEYQRLRSAERAINTRAASAGASEIHARHMTSRYAKLVEAELQKLMFRRRKPALAQKTSKAKVEVTPVVSPELKHLSAEKVFSEGERTAIALACFLAELQLSDDRLGLIFDDPVSSLDHHIREHVARRLVAAAKERQVIVFTHDLAFLADLREQARRIQSVPCEFRTLTSTDFHAGYVEEEEPFGARSVTKRVKALKTLLVEIEKHAKAGELDNYRSKARDFYQRMRSTWERFIEERVFAEVVQRLERNVVPGALAKVAYTRDLAELVHEGWRRCSNVIEAHDHAAAAGTPTFSLEEMRAELDTLVEAERSTKS